jgi:hypothetical protein
MSGFYRQILENAEQAAPKLRRVIASMEGMLARESEPAISDFDKLILQRNITELREALAAVEAI